jgi:hypothetical protein
MEPEPLTKSAREQILNRESEILAHRETLIDKEDFAAARACLKRAEELEAEYFARLPRLIMSYCPFDQKPLIRTFDPFGLNGHWWEEDAITQELPSCPHFCVLVGAVSFAGLPPRAGRRQVNPGPQVPYVIPRLLDYEGMIAVISRITMDNGYLAYPIAYFALRRPPPQDLTAGWARSIHSYKTQLGELGWKGPNDPWDFELKPWLQAGKIRWCPPGADNTFLSTEPWELCPYLDLPGERQRMEVQQDRAWTAGLPGGLDLNNIGD